MKTKFLLLCSLFFLFYSCKLFPKREQAPNIVFILADDLGYGELGSYGQEIIQTPNIDALATNGMRFTQHYSGAPVCAPARCILLTGKHSGHAQIRKNDPMNERGNVHNYVAVLNDASLEGEKLIVKNTTTVAHLLQSKGYKTAVIGKWGLGAPETEGVPNLQGFDYFYGYNCQRQAHNLYPPHLWENNERVLLDNELIIPHKSQFDNTLDKYDASNYSKYTQKEYAPALMQQKALKFIKDNKNNPFFMYYASPLPHLPLQVPAEYVEKYHKIIGEEEPYLGDKYFPSRYPRATYAGMISYLDDQVGELIQTLKDEGVYENTLIIFTSDNGPTWEVAADVAYFKSSYPFTNGKGRTKGFLYEGGVRIPMIAVWANKISSGVVSEHISTFYDFLATACDIANIAEPSDTDGISYLPNLLGKKNQEQHNHLYWEFPSYYGQQAVRWKNWKGVRQNMFKGQMDIELYNLDTNIQEQNNVASLHLKIIQIMDSIMKKEHVRSENENFHMKILGD